MISEKKSSYIQFYKKMLLIAFPIMLQNGISNFVNLLDNIMIGRVGTEEMSGVAIVNQLMFVFFLCIFGAVSGAGIFTAQFYGQQNHDGVRKTFRFKLVAATILSVIAFCVFYFGREPLINMYLADNQDTSLSLENTYIYACKYMLIILTSLILVAIENTYSSTLRECGQTFVPMIASVIAVVLNLVFNYVLIYGKMGFPCLGVEGAAIATVIARIVQTLIVVIWTHVNKDKNPFIVGAYRFGESDNILVKKIIIMGLPLFVNETLWAAGLAAQTQAYSIRGLEVVAGLNINSTIYNVFNIGFIALGDAVAIIVGQLLGANKKKDAKEAAFRIMAFSVVICIVIGTVLFFTAPLFPKIYETTDDVRNLAATFLRITAMVMPIQGLLHVLYFTIRSGGKTFVTFLFDSAFLWVVVVPISYFLSHFTGLTMAIIFLLVNLMDAIKVGIGLVIYKSEVWMNNIVDR